jgi:enoyl-CoA hydratase/carnithine racemase
LLTLHVDSDTVLYELSERVLTLTLNRPERNNAWNVEMERALHSLLFQASANDSVVAIVLTGAGRSFCPGFDSQSLEKSASGDGPSAEDRTQLSLPAMIPKPIVCAINGACAGVGLSTALMCDVRFADEDAKLATAFSKRGLPAEEGISWVLPRMIGHAAAMELLLSSRAITGREAASLGMVHRALPGADLLPAALDYARELAASCSPSSMAVIKRQVYRDWDVPLAYARLEGRRLMYKMREESDFTEGVQSLVERRPANFRPRSEVLDPKDYALE